jgi:hypothetical protein
MPRAPVAPRIQAITVERVPGGIRARAWVASAVARFWQPLEEDVLASEDAVTRWMSSLDIRHARSGAALLVGPELMADTRLMDAIKRGMK